MGVADFPVELIKSFKPRPTSTATDGTAAPHSDDATSMADREPTLSRLPPTDSASKPQEIPGKASTTNLSSRSQDEPLKHVSGVTASRSNSTSTDRKSELRSPSPPSKQTKKPFDPSTITLESAIGASKGISRVVGAGLKSPMDFTLGLARGFHNAPKLYGDDTVRPQERVTDFQSGLKAAGKVRSLFSFVISF
jgi:hypothetical protein